MSANHFFNYCTCIYGIALVNKIEEKAMISSWVSREEYIFYPPPFTGT